MAAYPEKLREYEAAKKKAKDGGPDSGEAPEEPVYRRVVLSDITIQKLAEILEENERGVLVARDELASWFGSFKQYKGKSEGSDLPNWLEMFRAGTVIVDRKTGDRRHYFVERAAVSICGGIQPGVLARAFTTEFLDAGGGARILMAMPPRKAKKWSEVEIQPEVEEAYHAVLDKLLGCKFDVKDGEQVPHALRLSLEAKAAWVAFYNSWAKEQAAAEGELAAAFGKLEAYAARFALLHHVVTRQARGEDDRVAIEKESIDAGVTLCHWFANEARRIYSTLTESEEQRDTRRLVEFIRSRGGKITPRQLMRSNNRRYPTVEDAESALDSLVEYQLGEWIPHPTTSNGGRPTRLFSLCMTHDTTDTTPDDEDDEDEVTPDTTPDTTADTTPLESGFPSVSEGSVSCVRRHAEEKQSVHEGDVTSQDGGGTVTQDGVATGGCVTQNQSSDGGFGEPIETPFDDDLSTPNTADVPRRTFGGK